MNAPVGQINIISILWGTLYNEEDVNRLFSMLQKNTSLPICFHLFSDESLPNLHPDIVQHPEPLSSVSLTQKPFNYRKEACLCDDNLGNLEGQRVFFFDLDVLIMGNLDALFLYPEGEQFYIINDWNSKGDRVGQATCYSFVVGTLGSIKEDFENNPDAIIQKFGTASQEFLSEKVIKLYGKLHFWPEAWFKSFRFHCLPWGVLRHFLTPSKPPPDTKVLAFHGHPDIRDALLGRWSPPNIKKSARGWKKIYKACKPTPWIKAYWQ